MTPGSGTHNILVASDLHIGEDLIEAIIEARAPSRRDSDAFCRFLAYYQDHCADDRPWMLIIAGDMIDFVRARILDEVAAQRDPLLRAAKALDCIVRGEPGPFLQLGRFIAAGHEVVILKGNHDVDLHWDAIRERLVDHLVAFAPIDPTCPRDQVRARIRFSGWFHYEPGLLYVEHGNQYDRFCSFENVLEPTLSGRADLEDPIAHQTLRAFGRLLFGNLDLRGIETRPLLQHFRWVAGLGPKLIAQLFWTYVASVKWMWSTRQILAENKDAKETHVDRIAETARELGLDEADLHALDDLRERPAGWHLRYGFRLLFIDHFVAAGSAAILTGAVWMSPISMDIRLGLSALLAAATAATAYKLAALRDVSPVRKLQRVAHAIRARLKVPYVVFGHSHVAETTALDTVGRAAYFNSGRFSTSLTHVCILAKDARAELRKWCSASMVPIPFVDRSPDLRDSCTFGQEATSESVHVSRIAGDHPVGEQHSGDAVVAIDQSGVELGSSVPHVLSTYGAKTRT
jgi:UDP-2,3-diacylglucosamine pyrophosphatase LpxH